MRITVLFQIVPDASRAAAADWSLAWPALLDDALPRAIDAFDESALEMALRLRDQRAADGADTELRAVTLGGEDSDDIVYRRLFALGFHAVTRIGRGTELYDVRHKARLIADAARGSDLLLCGMKSGLGGSGMTGRLCAAMLDLPLVSNVCSIETAGAHTLRAVSEAEGLRRRLCVQTPAALMIGGAENAWLRVPTLRARMSAANMAAELLPEQVREAPRPAQLLRPGRKKVCRFLPDNAPQAARALLCWLSEEDAAASPDVKLPAPEGLALFGADEAAQNAAALCALTNDAPLIANVRRAEGTYLISPLYAGAVEAAYPLLPGMIGTLDRRGVFEASMEAAPAPDPEGIREEDVERIEAAAALSGAPRVLVVGRGIGSAEAAERTKTLAERLGLAFGATRPAVMNGWAPLSAQVGISGAMLCASRCLVLGASGLEAFLSAIPERCRIAAVNTDPDALIFGAADIGYVGDAAMLLRSLEEALQ